MELVSIDPLQIAGLVALVLTREMSNPKPWGRVGRHPTTRKETFLLELKLLQNWQNTAPVRAAFIIRKILCVTSPLTPTP